eukprot:7569257-Prorocentrum_lima.AAC.1
MASFSGSTFDGAFFVKCASSSSNAVHRSMATTLPDLIVSQDVEHWRTQPDICRLAAVTDSFAFPLIAVN